jgi:pyruvate kinase
MDSGINKILVTIRKLEKIKKNSKKLEDVYKEELKKVHPVFKESSINLINYLALRQMDMEPIMDLLGSLGLSRLNRAERNVMSKLDSVLDNLRNMIEPSGKITRVQMKKFLEGYKRERTHTTALLGPVPADRRTRIMVTLPSDAAFDYDLIYNLINADVNCFRINCAHDAPEQWKMMIDKIKKAKKATGKECRVCMDLSGPKFRTGHMRPGPKVLRLRPEKNEYGIVVNPKKFWIAPPASIPEDLETAHVPVDESWFRLLKKGSVIRLQDARGKRRTFKIIQESFRGHWAIVNDSAYVRTGTRLNLLDRNKRRKASTIVGELPPLEERILLRIGDLLIIHKKAEPGSPSVMTEDGTIVTPAHISCPLVEIFTDTRKGEKVLLDDGKIEGIIEKVNTEELIVRITWAEDNGSRLAADKGINLPESRLNIKGLTEKDVEDLKFIAKYADLVSVSFVKDTKDVQQIREAINKVNGQHLGVILKIETQQGYDNLPGILLSAMQFYPVGIMIARGDLAVEVGWQKLAEVQEEILKLCSAAHIPDIWATQVLETLAKKGRPSRAEITDAAMAQRADCVMLNKGPHIIEAIKMLDEIIRIMQKPVDARKPIVKHKG